MRKKYAYIGIFVVLVFFSVVYFFDENAETNVNDEVVLLNQKNNSLGNEGSVVGDFNLSESIEFKKELDAVSLEDEAPSVIYRWLGVKALADHDERLAFANEMKKLFLNDSRVNVRAAALIGYSRIGTYEDTIDMLRLGRDEGIISFDDYYGELVYALPELNSADQSVAVDEIINSNNEFGYDVLIDGFSNSEYPFSNVDRIDDLRDYVSANPPKFDADFSLLGFLDVVKYEKWINAQINMSINSYELKSDFIFGMYSGGFSDPRFAVVLMHSDFIEDLRIENPSFYGEIDSVAQRYYDSYPDNFFAKIKK